MSRFQDDLEDELSEEESADEAEPASDKKHKSSREPDLADLQELGFTSGPSVLLVPDKPADGAEASWDWGRGERVEEVPESREEREQNRAAAGSATEDALRQAQLHKHQMAKLREQERDEHAEKQQQRRQTFQQREKRKRDTGQAKRGKNYVEEEKRHARSFGVYSGFD